MHKFLLKIPIEKVHCAENKELPNLYCTSEIETEQLCLFTFEYIILHLQIR